MTQGSEIYLIGETHTAEDHARIEEDVVREEKPGYVLLEGLDNQEYDDLQQATERVNETYTVHRIAEYMQEQFEENPDFTPSGDEYESDETPDEDTPWPEADPERLMELQSAVFDRLIEETGEYMQWVNEDRYDDEVPGPSDDQTGEDAIETADGETVEAPADTKIQELERLGDRLTEYVTKLYEQDSTAGHRVMNAVQELREDGYDTKLAGCDIDKREYFAGMSEDEVKEAAQSGELSEKRETTMAERIAEKADQTDDGVVAVVGKNHVDNVRQKLQEKGYNVKERKLEQEDQGGFGELKQMIEGGFYANEVSSQLADD